MSEQKINNIGEYIQRTGTLSKNGYSAYRGQCCSSWFLEPGLLRSIKKTYSGIGQSGLLFEFSNDHTIKLLKTARDKKLFKKDECDWRVLAVLQHYGAATPLLDFTGDPLVALYFACQPFPENDIESDGKIFCLNFPKQVRSLESPIREVSDPSHVNVDLDFGGRHAIWHWRVPEDFPCKRCEKQQSIFVFGWGLYWEYNTNNLIDELKILTVSAEGKEDILKELKEKHDISKKTLFPGEKIHFTDIHDFAKSNSCDNIIQHFSAKDFYEKGEEMWRGGNREWAAGYYKMAYKKKHDWIDARCKCARALNWNVEQSDALEVIEESIKECGKHWKFLVCKADVNEVLDKDWETDLEKAKKMASEVNESREFDAFLGKYGGTISSLRKESQS